MNEVSQFVIIHLWESSLFGVACCALIFALGKSWSFSRHLLAWSATVKFLIPLSVLSWFYDKAKGVFAGHTTDAAGSIIAPYIGNFSEALRIDAWLNLETSEVMVSEAFPWGSFALGAWLLGLFVITCLWIRQYRRVKTSLIAGCEEAGSDWQRLAKSVWGKPQRAMPRILICEDQSLVAGVFGMRRPAVIIPASFSLELNEEERVAFLLHEFQHIYKRDNLWLFAQKFIRNLFWVHPLVWWLDRQISAEREIMRDEEVIRKTNNVTSYLNCLMKVSNIKLPSSYATSVGIKGSPFARRIKSIGRLKASRLMDWLSAVGSISAILVLTLFLSATLSISNLQAAEERDEPSQREDWKSEFKELSSALEKLKAEEDRLAQEIEAKNKSGQVVSDSEYAKFKNLQRRANEIEYKMQKREIEKEAYQLKKALQNDSLNDKERGEILGRLKLIRSRFRDSNHEERTDRPKMTESERPVVTKAFEIGKTDKGAAIDLLNDLINEDSSVSIYYYIGVLHSEAGDQEKAMEFFNVALDKFPGYRQAAKRLGILQAKAGSFTQAKVTLLKALSLGAEDDGATYGFLALCYLNSGDGATAEYNYRIALKRNRENEEWGNGLERSLKMQRKKGPF
jgi:beta-lactamase regulating signal transducer with metallopeptidase domain